MPISDKELVKLQNLCKLNLTNDTEVFKSKLNNAIEMIAELKEVDCREVKPLRSVCDSYQRTNSDKVTSSGQLENLFKNVPDQESSLANEVKCFIVPKIID